MSNINDLKRSALILANAPSSALNEMEILWLNAITRGAILPDLNDLWRDYMLAEDVAPDQLNDMHRNFLQFLENSGESLPDLWRSFWGNGAKVPLDEEINDVGFDTPANWTTGVGWSVVGSVAGCTGAQTNPTSVSNTGQFSINGRKYIVSFDIVTW